MREYDFKSAKRYVQMHADLIQYASLGMDEDWFWTAICIFQDGRFTVNMDDPNLMIAGITGSVWATPVLEVDFKDGTTIKKDCFVGEAEGPKPEWFSLGVLSGPCQDARAPKQLSNDNGT